MQNPNPQGDASPLMVPIVTSEWEWIPCVEMGTMSHQGDASPLILPIVTCE